MAEDPPACAGAWPALSPTRVPFGIASEASAPPVRTSQEARFIGRENPGRPAPRRSPCAARIDPNTGTSPPSLRLAMLIRTDDLSGPEIRSLLEEHLRHMHELSPPESVHALDLDQLRRPDVTFWTVWSGAELLGCGALRELDARHGEVKSMRTAAAHRRRGAGRAMLEHILREARARGYSRLSLETGSVAGFEAARRLYESFGFEDCPPFGDYVEDPHSVYMTKAL